MQLTPAQIEITNDNHRFRVLCCGRRFGKTTLSVEEIKGMALYKNARIAYIAPTFGQARDIAWEMLRTEMRSVIKTANDTRLEMRVTNTVRDKDGKLGESLIFLRGWEAISNLRGQFFDLLILDEVRDMRDFKRNWEEILLPTLTDTRGSAMFISTPAGFDHFYNLYGLEAKNPSWKSFRFSTYDNPHIAKEEIDQLKESMNEDAFAQEYMADFRKKTGLVFKDFDRNIHVQNFETDKTRPLFCGQDFGWSNPAAVLFTYFDSDDNWYIVDEYYQRQKTRGEQCGEIKAIRAKYENPLDAVYGDSEDPQAIKEFADNYWYITPAKKGPGSVKAGIDKITERLKHKNVDYLPKIIIHPRCEWFIYELERRSWKDRKGDDKTNDEVPAEGDDHLCDCATYIIDKHNADRDIVFKSVKSYRPMGGYS